MFIVSNEGYFAIHLNSLINDLNGLPYTDFHVITASSTTSTDCPTQTSTLLQSHQRHQLTVLHRLPRYYSLINDINWLSYTDFHVITASLTTSTDCPTPTSTLLQPHQRHQLTVLHRLPRYYSLINDINWLSYTDFHVITASLTTSTDCPTPTSTLLQPHQRHQLTVLHRLPRYCYGYQHHHHNVVLCGPPACVVWYTCIWTRRLDLNFYSSKVKRLQWKRLQYKMAIQ